MEDKQGEIIRSIKNLLGIPKNFSAKPSADNIKDKHILRQGFEMFVLIAHCPNPDLYYWQELYKNLLARNPIRSILQTVVNNMKNPEIAEAIGHDTNLQLFTALHNKLGLAVNIAEVLLSTRNQLLSQTIPFNDDQKKCIEHDDCKEFRKNIAKGNFSCFLTLKICKDNCRRN